jgi:hypothetical protein
LIQVYDEAAFQRGGVQRIDRPLFPANSASTRFPNPFSCWRQRRPSAINRPSIRLRLMASPRFSFKYAPNRSKVQLANGKSKVSGAVKAVAITTLTSSVVYVGGRPERR